MENMQVYFNYQSSNAGFRIYDAKYSVFVVK